jgi:hypothetical protein
MSKAPKTQTLVILGPKTLITPFFHVLFRPFSTKSDSIFAQNSKFLKKILSAYPTSSYENPESKIEADFRIKRAGISNYRGRYLKYVVFCDVLIKNLNLDGRI